MGRPYKFTPEEFEQAWEDYFSFCDNNPWYKNEAIKSGPNAGEIIAIPVSRPYTEAGFCAFHGLGHKYLPQLEQTLSSKENPTEEEKALSNVLTRARARCYAQKFEGAAVGAFNPVIIARDLGLRDKQDIDHTTKGEAINVINLGGGVKPPSDSE